MARVNQCGLCGQSVTDLRFCHDCAQTLAERAGVLDRKEALEIVQEKRRIRYHQELMDKKQKLAEYAVSQKAVAEFRRKQQESRDASK